jgi:hypothetical protein
MGKHWLIFMQGVSMKQCCVTGCDNKYRAKGLCGTHWKINKAYGTPTPLCWCGEPAQTNGGRKGASLLCKSHNLTDRFWGYVEVKSDEECWEWQGSRTAANYGLLYWHNELQYAHRISLELDNRPVPDRWHACHTCDNPPCVNPKHLFPGTPHDNVKDKVSKSRHIFGEKHPNSKLSDTDVIEIRRLASEGVWQSDLARKYEVHPGHISVIVAGLKRRNTLDKE